MLVLGSQLVGVLDALLLHLVEAVTLALENEGVHVDTRLSDLSDLLPETEP